MVRFQTGKSVPSRFKLPHGSALQFLTFERSTASIQFLWFGSRERKSGSIFAWLKSKNPVFGTSPQNYRARVGRAQLGMNHQRRRGPTTEPRNVYNAWYNVRVQACVSVRMDRGQCEHYYDYGGFQVEPAADVEWCLFRKTGKRMAIATINPARSEAVRLWPGIEHVRDSRIYECKGCVGEVAMQDHLRQVCEDSRDSADEREPVA